MLDNDLFRGELVRLMAEDTQKIAEAFSRWQRDSEFLRLAGGDQRVPRRDRRHLFVI